MNIGLTGGIACGKSTVASLLVGKGAILIDADRIAREVVEPGTPGLADIAAKFGQAVLQPDGSLNRKALGAIVFQEAEKRKALEAILHPRIRERMRLLLEEAEAAHPDRLVVVDIPLLYESGLQDNYEQIMVVYVPEAVQIQRLIQRDQIDEAEARRRIQSQMPIEEKRQRADILIDNSGTLAETERQVLAFWSGKGLP
ncbi:dephospho-CoA kinase [Paenibacillus sp. y28]|uniref:dephospho-CoA kinase n=1 Tax=Paenibacillus sp. y28 TaxID=3129110 RepID=UPI003015B90B